MEEYNIMNIDKFAPIVCKLCNISEVLYKINKEFSLLYIHKTGIVFKVDKDYKFKDCYPTSKFITKKLK